MLLLHAEGDEQVPVEHSRELAAVLSSPRSRLITLPGGHHRSIQHDAEMQAVSLRFIERALAKPQAGPAHRRRRPSGSRPELVPEALQHATERLGHAGDGLCRP